MARSVWHRSLWSMLALCGVLLATSLHLHGAQPAGASPPTRSAATSVTGATAAVPECTNADLKASYRARDAGVGHRYGALRLRNTSDSTCWVRGFGGLSYVGGGDGTQVGAAADRDGAAGARVVLEPGDRATSQVDEVVAVNYPRSRCRPTPVDGFRVYVPDSTQSQFVRHRTTGCGNDAVHLISHRAFRG
ncbi:Protein of unknown function [Nocardioides exalbidus]|uniref:DUF4232 domain-containing protein n=1 Tax=Nocardioides exalbidus TaxID=402596 RepID=A0A1H4S4D1_9ACTN|nr:DUF4232 domain-containing protein [Nocardioides exalbidus]SEC38894.1 Protein of unknown function [Nocardioides exalbidus]